jgi:WD40 repeat protein
VQCRKSAGYLTCSLIDRWIMIVRSKTPVDDPWHPNSRYALTVNQQSVIVWDVESGERVARLLGDAPLQGGQWTSDGHILTWGDDGYWRVWRVMLENSYIE